VPAFKGAFDLEPCREHAVEQLVEWDVRSPDLVPDLPLRMGCDYCRLASSRSAGEWMIGAPAVLKPLTDFRSSLRGDPHLCVEAAALQSRNQSCHHRAATE
jgi:hypothetical protein